MSIEQISENTTTTGSDDSQNSY